MKYKFGFGEHSFSTQVYIICCVCSAILGCLGWASEYYNWIEPEKASFLIREIVTIDVAKCFLFSGTCFLLGIAGWSIDKLCLYSIEWRNQKFFKIDYDLDSSFWVGASVAIAVLCAIIVIPKLNRWMMIQKYGHDMGFMTDYWSRDGAWIASFQKIIMYILSVILIILVMRQWIRMVVNSKNRFGIVLMAIITFLLYPAAAIILSYCISEVLAIIAVVAVVIGLFGLFGSFGEAVIDTKQADEIDRTNNWIAMEYADEKVLKILANNHLGRYKLGNEASAKQILKQRNRE